jgi:thioesterase domain-containing protein
MPNQNFVAVQLRGLDERARPDRSVHAAAHRNVLAVRARQPIGPYRLGGYSYGAFVAFEMACMLEAAGEEVALLVVIDDAAPGMDGARPLDMAGRVARWVAQARMARRYRPTRTYGGPLLLVRGAPRARWDFGWSDHATGAIDVVDVSDDHLGLLRPPAVERIARHVERALG